MTGACQVEITQPSMTNDCSRIFNILSDWALMEKRSCVSADVFSLKTVRQILEKGDTHSQRLAFALSLMLGTSNEECGGALEGGFEQERLLSVLDRCRRRNDRLKIS